MNEEYKQSVQMIMKQFPETIEIFEQYKEIEFEHGRQFNSFARMIHTREKDEYFDLALANFFSANNHIKGNEEEKVEQLLRDLFSDLNEFDDAVKPLYEKFLRTLFDVIKSKELFKNTLTEGKANAFLDGIGYLLDIRIKCLSYFAALAIIEKWYGDIPNESTRISFLEQINNIKVDKLPNRVTALKYGNLFLHLGFFTSE